MWNLNTLFYKNNEFVMACSSGDLEKAKNLQKNDRNVGRYYNEALFIAYTNNHHDIAIWLFNLGANFSKFNADNDFMVACFKGNLDEAMRLQRIKKNINKSYDEALYIACINERYNVAIWLIHLGAKNDYALKIFCKRGNFEIVKILCDSGINANMDNDSLFITSCEHGHLEIAEFLFDKGANIHSQNDLAFRKACGNNQFYVAQWLLDVGAYMHAVKDDAFKLACLNGHLEIMEWLIKRGVVIKSIDSDVYSKTYMNNKFNIIEWLATQSVNLDSVFIMACVNGDIKTAKWLFEIGVDPNNINENDFINICEADKIEIIKWLVEIHFDISKFDFSLFEDVHIKYITICFQLNFVDTLLFRYIISDNVKTHLYREIINQMTKLLEEGANHKMLNDFPFKYACKTKNVDLVKLLSMCD